MVPLQAGRLLSSVARLALLEDVVEALAHAHVLLVLGAGIEVN